LTPHDLGAPERFQQWRPGQDLAFQHILDSQKRFDIINAPTGLGKTLLGVLYAHLMQLPTIILTSTKGLQDQYVAALPELVTDLRGMGNYDCRLLVEGAAKRWRKTPKCDEGPCLDGDKCSYLENGCHYFDAFRRAQKAPIVVTNYSLWFSLLGGTRHLGTRQLLVCDEAHDAPEQVAKAVGCELDPEDVDMPERDQEQSLGEWKQWAEQKVLDTKLVLQDKSLAPWKKRKLRSLGRSLVRLAHSDSTWLKSKSETGKWTFQPLWPAPYAEQWLFRAIPKVVMLSATITPQTVGYLGLKPEDYHYLDLPSPFPAARRPIVHVPTVRVNKDLDEDGLRMWVTRIDQVIRARQDRKGIIHTVSYARAKALYEQSEFRHQMLLPRTSDETRKMVAQFKAGAAPLVLVSPSVGTGYDFPYDAARFQIIGKLPFPDLRDPIVSARAKADDNFLTWSAITGLVQMSGRVVRAEDDLGETIVIDDTVNAPWILKKNARMFPKWWMEAYRSQATLPKPIAL